MRLAISKLREAAKYRVDALPLNVYRRNMTRFVRRAARAGERSKAPVYFDIRHNRFERHLYNFLFAFDECGHTIRLRHRWGLFARSGAHRYDFGRLLFELPRLEITLEDPHPTDIVLSAPGDRGIPIDENLFCRDDRRRSFTFPIGMHPNMYARGLHLRADELSQSSDRPICVSFAGGSHSKFYDLRNMQEVFGKAPRHEVVDALIEALEPGRLWMPEGEEEASRPPPDTDVCVVRREKLFLPPPRYQALVARSSFFLCPPGFATPLCHNATEALAVGTAPVIEYGELFDPPLEDGVNCLHYEGAPGAVDAVRRALEMSPARRDELRRGARTYYEQHLSPKAIVDAVIGGRDELDVVYLNANTHSVSAMIDSRGTGAR